MRLSAGARKWFGQPRYEKAFDITRWLIAVMLILGGIAIYNSSVASGVGRVIFERGGFLLLHSYGVLTVFCGLLVAVISAPTLRQFFICILPIFLFLFFLGQGILLGITTVNGGTVFLLVLVGNLCVTLYGFSEKSVVEMALNIVNQYKQTERGKYGR